MNQRLVKMAQEAVHVTTSRHYRAPSGRVVKLPDGRGSIYHPPDQPLNPLPQLLLETVIQVTQQSTLAALRDQNPNSKVAALNFASARNPGGGFLRGAVAQEESIARSSTLIGGLKDSPYYTANRAQRSGLYTDGIIYSPEVWVFRDDRGQILEEPFKGAFITAPAVNVGALNAGEHEFVHDVMTRRSRRILEVAAHHGTEVLILGAWGCGVFGNNPRTVASMFADHLSGGFSSIFDKVVFPIPGGGQNLQGFMEVLGC